MFQQHEALFILITINNYKCKFTVPTCKNVINKELKAVKAWLVSLQLFIFLFLNYGISSWSLSYETHQKHLFLLQKKVLRCISFRPYCSPSLPIFHSLKVLTLKDLIHFNILNFVYKSINKFTPPVFHNFFQLSQNVHLYGTRQASRGDLFQTSKNTIQYGLRSMQYFGSKLWDTIPIYVRINISVSIFKSKLNEFLINAY